MKKIIWKKKKVDWQLLEKSNILVLGYGKEGKETLSFLRDKFPKKVIGIADERDNIVVNDARVRTHFGKNYLKSISRYDIIIKSPGIPSVKLKPHRKKKIITSQTDIFLNLTKGTIIGITGTKGKSAVASATYKILKENLKEDVHLIGNIGVPALSFLEKKGVFVFELSSFQLEEISKSPHIAVILNIYKDHLDNHESFHDYLNAKKNITLNQKESDFLIYNSKDPQVESISKISKAKPIPFNPQEKIKDSVVYFEPVLKIAEIFEISEDNVKRKLRSFRPLPHRLEYIGEFEKIKFYNDSAATIPEATVSAIKNLEESLDTLIVGGKDKGVNYSNLAEIISRSKIKNLILFPETGEKIRRELERKEGQIRFFPVNSMKEAVKTAFKETGKGKICLLSPASSSFNMFENYKERGNIFKEEIKKNG